MFMFAIRLNPDGLFGYQLLDPKAEEVVLTVNEFDAVAIIHQMLPTSVLSLPRGLLTLPQEVHESHSFFIRYIVCQINREKPEKFN